jgi:hypothetical protein
MFGINIWEILIMVVVLAVGASVVALLGLVIIKAIQQR